MIKLSQKRTCEGCRALDIILFKPLIKCTLGYDVNTKFEPLEPCPKPKTFMELFECQRLYKK
jgi:hypothetical protein